MFDIRNGELKISVRNLVEFLCRSGDIDNRFGGVSDKTAMDAGARIHKKIQKSMGPDYRDEVTLSYTQNGDKYNIIIDGRADGIFPKDDITYIDEIKGTYRDLKYISEPVYVHRAQAMCYAYFYALDNDEKRMGIRMTYANLDDESKKYFEEVLSFKELKDWFDGLMAELTKWGDYLYEHRLKRNASIKNLAFPFEYREGQRGLCVSVYKAIAGKRNLFIQAPTGVGKTISTVYPAVMSMGEGLSDKIFYLTAKTITRTAAEEAFSHLRQGELDFKTITITAKDKICFQGGESGPECNPIACPYAKGHNDRVNDAVYDLITHESVITRQVIEEYATRHEVCPFEFALDVSYWMDGIICDYNYVFDPHVYLKRFFSENATGEYVFLVDEAHNLVDRAREMYSASVYKEQFLAIKKLVIPHSARLAKALDACNSKMLSIKRRCDEEYMELEDIDALAASMVKLSDEMVRFMEKNRDFAYMKELSEFFFDVMHFNQMYEGLNFKYITYAEHCYEGFMVRLFCVDPSDCLKERLGKGDAAVFFSATLLPVNYYKEMLSGNREDDAVYAHSVFDPGKRLLIIGRDVTSRYTRRNENEYRKVKRYIDAVTGSREGNYLVFFPSYKYMQDVLACYTPEDEIFDRIRPQTKDMTESDKEEYLKAFLPESSLVGFCVMGGIFSEGIDLKEDRLIGAVIVGTGLPQINVAGELLRRYYDEKSGTGYDYAYVYPGMNKVLQAAGRVIRTDKDRGVIALLDDRFLTPGYRSLFPREWEKYTTVTENTVAQEILEFWHTQ